MKYDSFIKKLRRRMGEDVEIHSDQHPNRARKEWIFHNGLVCSWRVERPWVLSGEKEKPFAATSFHSRRQADEPDSMTDYFPGTYWNNATQLIDYLAPPPAKFTPGALVMGKPENKRAVRHGYAGKIALVTKTSGKYMNLRFVISGDDEWLNTAGWRQPTFPVRDFELVSG